MTAHARKYFERAPRYVLHPLDSSMMRFKGEDPEGFAVPARVVNVSTTGLSFTMQGPELPEVDETLMIEFTIPGKKQIACLATVIRVDTHAARPWHPQDEWTSPNGETSTFQVALSFQQLPKPFHNALSKSLKERVASEENFDVAAETSLFSRAFQLGLATCGLVLMFQTLQIPPHRFIEFVAQLVA